MTLPTIKPLRIILLLGWIGLTAAYLPHPAAGPSLPEKLIHFWRFNQENNP